MERLEFHISYRCSNRCIFCNERDRIEEFGPQPVDIKSIEHHLIIKRKEGFNHVTFTGGEPTLVDGFIDILRFSKDLGYTTYTTSNGAKFCSRTYTKEALKYLDEICLSLHGDSAKLHNLHTQNCESFSKIIKAFENISISSKKLKLSVNTVVTKFNIDKLEKIVRLILRYNKVKNYIVSNIAPEGDGLRNFSLIVTRLHKFKKQIKVLAGLARKHSLTLRFFGIPLCILGKDLIYSNDLFWDQRATIEKDLINGEVVLNEVRDYLPQRNRVKTVKCKACIFDSLCGGVFNSYISQFQGNELTSITLL